MEEHGALRAELAGFEERQRSERATQTRHEAQLRRQWRGAAEIAAEMERLGVERARLLSDNIELDQRAGELWNRFCVPKTVVARAGGAGNRAARESCGAR